MRELEEASVEREAAMRKRKRSEEQCPLADEDLAEVLESPAGDTPQGKMSSSASTSTGAAVAVPMTPASRSSAKPARQMTIEESAKRQKREEADQQVVMYFYANGVPFAHARSPYFQRMVSAVSKAGPGYCPPHYNKLRTTLLDQVRA